MDWFVIAGIFGEIAQNRSTSALAQANYDYFDTIIGKPTQKSRRKGEEEE